ncbi:Ig-like domain-containing protein [Nocardioides cynanchi]|uniref:Ig-like domain-containing protein n=1 Tax=Nocardioides cynanchi TaxID=2558918 RepID=UPI00124575E1|nr:Ig-like domain-containing protein [Nocardioides cynanchi]
MRTRLRVLGATVTTAVVAVAVPLVTSSQAHAARFTGGDVVVYRVGSGGASPLTNAAAPVFLDEYAPGGSLVQSVALPTTAAEGNARLTASGQSRSEGLIDRSADGRFLAVTGYDAAVGATGPSGASLTASDPAQVGRVVGLVDANGTVDTTTVLTGAGVTKIIRSATTTDGERLWATGGNGGVVTTNRGSSAASTVAGSATSNLSALTVQGGQLFSSGILTDRLARIGTGVPTSGALTDLPGLPDNLLTYGYALADLTPDDYAGTGLDTLYIADGSARGGTVDKYRWNGTTWASAGYVDVEGAFGIVADVQGASVSLAVTTPTSLVTLTDPAGAAASFAPSAPTVLATAAPNTEFRGVALAPTAAAGPSVFLRTPAAGSSVPLGGTVKVSAYVASPAGVGAVEAKLGSGAFVAATQSGHVWTAQVPTTGLKTGAATVTFRATDTAATPATTTVTRSVTLGGSAVPAGNLPAGSYPWSAKKVKLAGTWKSYRTSHSPSGKGEKSAKRKSTATAKVYGHGATLTFDRSAKAGKVKVTVDGRSTTLDLYNKAGKPLKKSWSFSGRLKSHTVVVTVLGKKDAASKGLWVLLAALKVKA